VENVLSHANDSRLGAVGGATFKFKYGGLKETGLDEQATISNKGPIAVNEIRPMRLALTMKLPS
jgi:hypothetical protein